MGFKTKLDLEDLGRMEKLYRTGLSDQAIGLEFCVSDSTVANWRKKNCLPPNTRLTKQCKLSSSIVDKNQFLELYDNGNPDKVIAEKLNVNYHTVFKFRHSLGLKSVDKWKKVELTNDEYQILLGHVFGDGTLRRPAVHACGKIEQGIKQKDYFDWKVKNLSKLVNGKVNTSSRLDARTGRIQSSLSMFMPVNPILTKLYDIIYIAGTKSMTKYNLVDLDSLGLATLFMDDGFKYKSGYGIATNCYDSASLIEFNNLLWYRFRIDSTSYKSGVTYIGKNYVDRLNNLIQDWIIPSMRYKLH